jgi:DNA modification methylase
MCSGTAAGLAFSVFAELKGTDMDTTTLINGDCLEIMRGMPDDSVDAVVTDPPYGMGREPDIAEVMRHWLAGESYEQSGGGFMGKDWDSFVPNPKCWRECFRVLKPGGHLLAFASSRTWDLMSISLRFAGFENRDTIVHFGGVPSLHWLYGSGFPKGLDIGKAIDKMAGKEREVIGMRDRYRDGIQRKTSEDFHNTVKISANAHSPAYETAPATPEAEKYDGYGTALKPAHEVILVFRKPVEGTVAKNALKHGTGGLNIDECRVYHDEPNTCESRYGYGLTDVQQRGEAGIGYAKKNYGKYAERASQRAAKGRWPANVIFSHHPECQKVGTKKVKTQFGQSWERTTSEGTFQCKRKKIDRPIGYADKNGNEIVPDWKCHPDCAVKELEGQSGWRKSGGLSGKRKKRVSLGGVFSERERDTGKKYAPSEGTAARYFKQFFYVPKASPKERKMGSFGIQKDFEHPDGYRRKGDKGGAVMRNTHPTVKPIALMRYLVRLVLPPDGGIILDPFMGSGTTGLACVSEGASFVGIEKDPEYFEIAKKRIDNEQRQASLFENLPN